MELDTFRSNLAKPLAVEARADEGDNETLARLGKRQVLKRRFGFMTMLSFSCTVLVTWEAVLVLFTPGFTNGGSAGLVYQFVFIWLGMLSTFMSIAELASIAPTAGGQYHWVYMLAPKYSRVFLSYFIGWMTVLAWQATLATTALLFATQVQGMIVLNHSETYTFERWHGTLLYIACVLTAILINTVVSNLLPKIEGLFMILHILGFFAILIPLLYLAPHPPASEALTIFLNEGAWPTQGLSFMVGSIGLAFAFVGADAAVHMSEEIEHATLNVPRSIVTTILLNGALGFGILLAVLFSIQDIDAALSTPTNYPYMEIFLSATQNLGGATAMAVILTTLAITATVGFTATSSRMIWSFARDDGLPFSGTLGIVEKRTAIPLPALLATTLITCLLSLINIGSTTAFNDVTSLSIAGFYTTYFASCVLLLWRRCTGRIKDYATDGTKSARWNPDTQDFELVWGPWRVPHIVGIANSAFACAFLAVIFSSVSGLRRRQYRRER